MLVADLAVADWSGWCPNAYTNGSTVGIFRFPGTNPVYASLWVATNRASYTNHPTYSSTAVVSYTFLSDVRLDVPPWGATVSNTRTYSLTDWTNTIIAGVTSWYPVARAYTVTNISALVQTNVAVQAWDAWAIDGYRLARERRAAAGQDPYDSGTLTWLENVFYRENRAQLIATKAALAAVATSFVDMEGTTSRVFVAGFTNGAVPMLDQNIIIGRAHGPSNWWTVTPWSELNGSGVGMGRCVTTRWTIVGSATGIVTNTSFNACNQPVTISGTNGQIVSSICTNADIEEGWTTLDYGWKFMPAVATQMQQTAQSGARETHTGYTNTYAWEQYCYWTNVCAHPWCESAATTTGIVASVKWRHEIFDGSDCGDALSYDWWNGGSPNAWLGVIEAARYKPDQYQHAGRVHTNALTIVTGRLPVAWAYESRSWTQTVTICTVETNPGDFAEFTNSWSSTHGWPLTVPTNYTLNLWSLTTNASGQANMTDTNVLVGPAMTDLNTASSFICADESVGIIGACGLGDAVLQNEIYFCDTGFGDGYWIGSGVISYFQYDLSPLTIFDWTASPTNGFQYR